MPGTLATLWSRLTTPSAEAMKALLDKTDTLRKELPLDKDSEEYARPRLLQIDTELAQLKAEAKRVPQPDEKEWPGAWQGLPPEKRRELAARADRAFDDLRALTFPERRRGQWHFVGFAALLTIVMVAYMWKHGGAAAAGSGGDARVEAPAVLTALEAQRPPAGWPERARSMDGLTDARIVTAATTLRLVELEASAQRDRKPADDAARSKATAAIRSRVAELAKALAGAELSFNTLQLLANVQAEAEHGTLLDSSDAVAKLRPVLLADLESARPGLFWADRVRRWFEIAWWAEIGVLVGILFYIAGLLSEGRFDSEDLTMMWTEVLIAPVVVPVIFFLLSLTGIGVNPSETAMTGNIGFAFVFGFAIRRTLGLLDTIKKRIFPDPTPP